MKWKDRFERDPHLKVLPQRTCLATVDCVDFPISEPRTASEAKKKQFGKKDPLWYSKKLNRAGVRYEVAIAIQTGKIVWVNGPFPCGQFNDVTIFAMKLKKKLGPKEMVECDNGYPGHPDHVRMRSNYVSKVDKRAKSLALARHEGVNATLKRFNVLTDVYRHNRRFHRDEFAAAVVLTSIGYLNGDRPWKVIY